MSITQAEQTAPTLPLTSRSDLRAVLTLALPVLGEQFLEFLVGIADTWLAGNCLPADQEVAALAAVGLMAYSIWMMFVIFSSVAIGATAVVARRIGEKDWGQAHIAAEQSVSLGLILSLTVTFAMWILAEPFVSAMQLEGQAHAMALEYLRIMIPAIPGFMLIAVITAAQHGAGDTVTGLVVMAIVNVLNLVISATLAIGVGPIPQLGWAGIAIGTSVSHLFGGLLLLAILLKGRAGLKIRLAGLKPQWERIRRLLRIGLPGGLNDALVLVCHLWYLAIINSLGTSLAAAHGLAVRIESPGYLSAWAFAVAASALTGQHLGAKTPSRAMRATFVSMSLAITLIGSYAILVALFGPWVTDFFLGSPAEHSDALATGQATNKILPILAIGLPFLAIFSTISGALRGAGDTAWPLIATVVGFLVVRMPLAYFLAWDEISLARDWVIPGMGWGITGAWLAMLADVIIRTLLIAGRYLQGSWKRIEV